MRWVDNEEGEDAGVPQGLSSSRGEGFEECVGIWLRSRGGNPGWCLGKSEISLNSRTLLLFRDRTIGDVWEVLL